MFIIFTQLFISSNRSYQKWSGILFSIAHSAHTKVSLSRFCRISYVWFRYLIFEYKVKPISAIYAGYSISTGSWQVNMTNICCRFKRNVGESNIYLEHSLERNFEDFLLHLMNLIRNILGTSKNVLPLQIYSQSLEDAQASDRIRPN